MTRWASDRDHADWLDGPHAAPNATCDDCGADYWKGADDADDWCDGCRAHRDAWTDACELRMVKATRPAAAKKEVA
jgi:hypothetical protein